MMLSTYAIAIIAIIIIGIWFWQANMRAKEMAAMECKTLCKDHHIQLLDDTVMLKKMTLKRSESGAIRLCRHYRFEYTMGDDIRRRGLIVILGHQIIEQQVNITGITHIDPQRKVIDLKAFRAENDDQL